MQRCLQLARMGIQEARPNPMVGAVIVADGRIIGEGYHVRCGEGHAEVNAFASVRAGDEHVLPDATIYVSLEPCAHYGKTPPCAELIIRKGVRRVVVGCTDPFAKVKGRGIQMLRDAGIEVTVGVLEKECQWLNRHFFTFHERQRPYILLKWAQSKDGFIDKDGCAVAFSTPFTKMLVHKLRAEYDAILVGRTTWEREQPALTVREWHGRNPHRFVLSSSCGIDDVIAQCADSSLQSLIVEGGRKTLQSFIDRSLYDEIRIETSPITLTSGTPVPTLPLNLCTISQEQWDDNTIVTLIPDNK
ncbi:MAG: bifunctional diaminohydroxyphosphoribosylaminopyrimidine deaminase/5-amino-6-(5-phosphoribosylamino)uracil reductase RibD [Prevotella sp.]|nr:bifunctional diaminohydroxyphosphoribosylaminopyrimidine deaminase/5-amino-6-(5-phosphoribosylamino)uracil reductase RibD [Prevotella sp.]